MFFTQNSKMKSKLPFFLLFNFFIGFVDSNNLIHSISGLPRVQIVKHAFLCLIAYQSHQSHLRTCSIGFLACHEDTFSIRFRIVVQIFLEMTKQKKALNEST